MSSGTKDFVRTAPIAPSGVLQLGSDQTFLIGNHEMNAVALYCNYTYAAGTALTFTFTAQVADDGDADYAAVKCDVGSGVISPASFTYTLSHSSKFFFTIPITGKNIKVTVSGTGTTNSDTIVLYPRTLVVA